MRVSRTRLGNVGRRSPSTSGVTQMRRRRRDRRNAGVSSIACPTHRSRTGGGISLSARGLRGRIRCVESSRDPSRTDEPRDPCSRDELRSQAWKNRWSIPDHAILSGRVVHDRRANELAKAGRPCRERPKARRDNARAITPRRHGSPNRVGFFLTGRCGVREMSDSEAGVSERGAIGWASSRRNMLVRHCREASAKDTRWVGSVALRENTGAACAGTEDERSPGRGVGEKDTRWGGLRRLRKMLAPASPNRG